jgi:hypothetical protein
MADQFRFSCRCFVHGGSPVGQRGLSRFRSAMPAVAALLALSVSSARAAEISYSTNKVNVIAIEGEIAPGDDNKFAQIVPDPQKKTGILLSSRGGNILAALAIGEMIHESGYATIVPDDQICASACGLIWLGGTSRYVSETAKIGFHAAYVESGAARSESGVANAMVGAYLTRIGLSYKAIAFLTSAPPEDIQWLHPDEARSIGIDFDTVAAQPSSAAWSAPSRTKPPVAVGTTLVPQSEITASAAEERAAKLVRSWYAMWSSMGTDTSALQHYYGDTIQYYGGTVLKAKVLLEKQRFAVRWPIRAYTVRADSLTVSCPSTCSVTGVIDWNVSSPERRERSIGSASFAMEIPATGPLIVLSENGKVLASHKEPLPSSDGAAGSASEPQADSASGAFADGRQARID